MILPVKKLLPADRSLTNGYSPIKTFSGDISYSFFKKKKMRFLFLLNLIQKFKLSSLTLIELFRGSNILYNILFSFEPEYTNVEIYDILLYLPNYYKGSIRKV